MPNYSYPIRCCAEMPIANGGKVVMTAPQAETFDEAVANLVETHKLYIASGGWGGSRAVKPTAEPAS